MPFHMTSVLNEAKGLACGPLNCLHVLTFHLHWYCMIPKHHKQSNSDSCLVLLPVKQFSHNFIHPISWNILSVFWLGLINTLKPSTIIRIPYPEVLSNTAIPHLVSSHSLWWYEHVKGPYGKRQLQISILSSKTRKLRWTLLITVT